MSTSTPLCQRVAKALAEGRTVIIPTDGYYVVAASARQPQAIESFIPLCGGPNPEPISALVLGLAELDAWGGKVSPRSASLAKKHWPGALSLRLESPEELASEVGPLMDVTAPAISFTRDLLTALSETEGHPAMLLCRPAHKSARFPVTRGEWLPAGLEKKDLAALLASCAFVVDAGRTRHGCEPTTVDAQKDPVVLLREGPLDAAVLAKTLGKELLLDQVATPDAPAKQVKLHLLIGDGELPRIKRGDTDSWAVAVGTPPKWWTDENRWFLLPDAPHDFIAGYYDALHRASAAGAKAIFVRTPNAEVSDRLGLSQSTRRGQKHSA